MVRVRDPRGDWIRSFPPSPHSEDSRARLQPCGECRYPAPQWRAPRMRLQCISPSGVSGYLSSDDAFCLTTIGVCRRR